MMFKPTDIPRVFGMPIGADFSSDLAKDLIRRNVGNPPENLAKVEIFVSTSRMRRSLQEAFLSGPATLLPRIRLITDLATEADVESTSDLRTKLELTQLIRALLERETSRAPRAALYDLSSSLFDLMDEMRGEGVAPEAIHKLNVSDQSGHWQNSLDFIKILEPYFEGIHGSSAKLRAVVESKISTWAIDPPNHPIIVAGSTGSRGPTNMFMQAVAKLSQGALILPGFDFELPDEIWGQLDQEDHPQFRFAALLKDLGIGKVDVIDWEASTPEHPGRNKLLSLALRPAPVTSDWIKDGPSLGPLAEASHQLTLVEADSPRQEAETIALRMRKAVDEGLKCALITPDRMLTRQVAAALDRWDLVADDSAGTPLLLSAPGRFLVQLANFSGRPIQSHELLTLLKHPLCHSTDNDRGDHLLWTRELELHVRRHGPPIPDRKSLCLWAEKQERDGCLEWCNWVADFLEANQQIADGPLSDLVERHVRLAETLSAGPNIEGSGGLWLENAGREAKNQYLKLLSAADAAGEVTLTDYATIFSGLISEGTVRDRDAGHPNLLVLGTLEARVQTADLVILGGLNESSWPEASSPDPWLNRQMRRDLGLLLPERQIGLSAHDFQQAAGAKQVWLTRSKRSADSETVASRWINRLTNLMDGLPKQGGSETLAHMRQEGDKWIGWATQLSKPVSKTTLEPRPSPCPPVSARPKSLSVTRIKTLIRDPYSIYAERILRLRDLDPLMMEPDAPLKGVIFHKILERFVESKPDANSPDAVAALIGIAKAELDQNCPWPAMRIRWLTQIEAMAPKFVSDECARQANGKVAGLELKGAAELPGIEFRLTGIADRIDISAGGTAQIYDYKTGIVPTPKQQEIYDKQLLLEAAMVEQGCFENMGPVQVESAQFISIKPDMKLTLAPLAKAPPNEVWNDFIELIKRPYDHLSRHGEWDLSSAPVKVRLS